MLWRRFLVFSIVTGCLNAAAGTSGRSGDEEAVRLDEDQPDPLPYFFEIDRFLHSGPQIRLKLMDLDHDGADDLILERNDQRDVAVLASRMDIDANFYQANFKGFIFLSDSTADLDSDGREDLFVTERFPEHVRLVRLDSHGQASELFSMPKPAGFDPAMWDCVFNVDGFMDVDRDGRPEAIVEVHTGKGFQPRGIGALDIDRRAWKWFFPTASSLTRVCLADINGDRRREIVFGTSAPDNGARRVVNGTVDHRSWLGVLDSLGNRIGIWPVGKAFSNAIPVAHDFEGDGRPDFIVYFKSHGFPKEKGFVALWDPATGRLRPRINADRELGQSVGFIDSDRDGTDEMVLAWDDGTVEIRTRGLDLVTARRFEGYKPDRVTVDDLNGDGEPEILLNGLFKAGYRLISLDKKLRLRAMSPSVMNLSDPSLEVVTLGYSRSRTAVVKLGDRYGLVRYRRQWIPGGRGSAAALAVGAGGALALCGLGFLAYRKTQNRRFPVRILHGMLQNASLPSLLLAPSGRLIAMNEAMRRALGLAVSPAAGTWPGQILSPPFHQLDEAIREAVGKNAVASLREITIPVNGGNAHYLMHLLGFLGDPKHLHRLLVLQDISELVQSKRAVAWASMAQRLAHETKTPLSTAQLSAQQLNMVFERHPDAEREGGKYLEHILGQIDRLRSITDAFLKFARIEKPRLSSGDVNQMIAAFLSDYRLKIGTGVKVVLNLEPGLPALRLDPDQFRLALENVVNNSLSAMAGRGVLTVATRLEQRIGRRVHGDAVQIEIMDTGRGLSREEQGRLFEPFFSNSAGGTGLGLVIVKKIVEDHGGKVHIESEPGIGTTARITLPAASTPRGTEPR